jgi:hypothetical protein
MTNRLKGETISQDYKQAALASIRSITPSDRSGAERFGRQI